MFGKRRILGLAVEEHLIAAVELCSAAGRTVVTRAEEFRFSGECSLQEPARLGEALRKFLLDKRFSAKHAIFGLPSKWLVVKEEQVPPVGGGSLAGILRLRAERTFASDLDDLAIDYVDRADVACNRPVVVVATLREKVDQIFAMAKAARIRPRAVTPSVAALGAAGALAGRGSGLTLYLAKGSAEFAVQREGEIRILRRIPLPDGEPEDSREASRRPRVERVADLLRRIVSLLPGGTSDVDARELTVWNGIGLEDGELDVLGRRLGVEVVAPEDLTGLGIAGSTLGGSAEICRFAPAAALGLVGLRPQLLSLDFFHSRLTVRRKAAPRRQIAWAGVLVIAMLAACLFLVADWRAREKEAGVLRGRLADMGADILAAREVIDRVSGARGWYDHRPGLLDCLRELTLAFPEDGRIWTTSLALTEDMRGLVSGKSTDESLTLKLLDALKSSGRFGDVKLLYTRGAESGGSESSFAMSFLFLDWE